MFIRKCAILFAFLLLVMQFMSCSNNKQEQQESRQRTDYIKAIPGKDDSIPPELYQRGEVLIAYSDCYLCHKADQRSAGPAFIDIAKRYPANKVYIEMLARKVIVGGSRNWGYPVMTPHPELSFEDAKIMVTYILLLEKNMQKGDKE